MTSPREQSTSSVSVSVTDWPATASGTSPSIATIRAMLLVRPEGRMRTVSPGFTLPLAISPEKPRKSRSGRLTHCTGMRKARACATSVSTSIVSRCSISVGPAYQGVASERVAILSPTKPDIGIAVKSVMPIAVAKAR
ncbi:hypothetical protein D9M73_171800 [compost metagenome]